MNKNNNHHIDSRFYTQQNILLMVRKNKRKIIPISAAILTLGIAVFLLIKYLVNPSSKSILAVNTDRTEYQKGDIVLIQASVLDNKGLADCNANLELNVNGVKTKDVKVSSTCSPGSVTNNPDYFFRYAPQKDGNYEVKLTNLNTKSSARNSFKVVSQSDIDVTREAATRINPALAERYPVRLIVKANKDFQGEISDTVPASFTIPWQGPAKVIDNGEKGKVISLQIELKAGETKELLYEFSAPKMGPALYKIGNHNEWQIVAEK